MLRALVVLLLLANGLFFAWSRGWLSPLLAPPHQGEREPERLAAQVRPETIKLVSPQAASAALAAAAPVCMEAGPFGDADIGVAEAALLAAGVPVAAFERRAGTAPGSWLVYMGRFGDATAMRTKEDELKRLRLAFDELRAPPDLVPGLVLSRHDSRDAAEQALAAAGQRGVRSARVVSLPGTAAQHWLRTPHADRDIQNRLAGLKPPVIAAPFVRCPKA